MAEIYVTFSNDIKLYFCGNTMTMYGESRKLHLIEEILKTEDEAILKQAESLFSKGKVINIPTRKSFTEFAGMLTDEEANEMKTIIEDGKSLTFTK